MGGVCASPPKNSVDDYPSTPTKPEAKKPAKKRDQSFPFVEPDNIVRDVWSIFIKKKELGKGASCEVDHVIRKADQQEFAMKVMKKEDKWNPILFKQEVDLLTSLNHPNILQYRDCYMDLKNFYVCTELCKGGELFDKIKQMKQFNENIASKYLKTILEAMHHCHEKNIVHRDLKPENIVFRTEKQEQLVIIDFGDAKVVNEEETYEDFVGTAFYLAPECVRDRKGWELKKSDMWTIGVIAYVLLTGRPPFFGRGNKEILKKILRGKVQFPTSIELSRSAKDFVLRLIRKSPKKRMSAKSALGHKWITGEDRKGAKDDIAPQVISKLSNFTRACKLKKVLIRIFSREMTKEDEQEFKRQFKQMDKDGDGFIDLHELTKYIADTGIPVAEAYRRASSIMLEIDQDGDNKITIQEFTDAKIAEKFTDDKVIRHEFKKIDVKNMGYITKEELSALFNWTLADEMILEMINEIDNNNDGKISLDEFSTAMKKGQIAGVFTPVKTELDEQTRKKLRGKLKNYVDAQPNL